MLMAKSIGSVTLLPESIYYAIFKIGLDSLTARVFSGSAVWQIQASQPFYTQLLSGLPTKVFRALLILGRVSSLNEAKQIEDLRYIYFLLLLANL